MLIRTKPLTSISRKTCYVKSGLVEQLSSQYFSLGTLSNDDDDDDDDGSENFAKKINLRSFKLNRVYLDPHNMFPGRRFLETFPGVEFLRDSSSKRGRKIRRRMSTSSIIRQIRRFHVVVVPWTSKRCTKKRDARAELLF